MRLAKHLLLCLQASCFVAGLAASAATLKSPWDVHPVAAAAKSYSCPTLAPLPKDIVAFDFYSDAKHSIIDPKRYAVYQQSQEQFRTTTSEAAKAADSFQATGNQGAATCVLQILTAEAKAEAMTGNMASNQSYYVQNWTLGALAVTWLKVRSAEPGTVEQRKEVVDWLVNVALATRKYFTERNQKGTDDGTNNHYYWAGFAVMASGIAANDQALYSWGEGTFMEAMKRVAPDGTLPLEMARGQRALHYHLFAIGPLIMMAEFGEANSQDLYAIDNAALRRLVTRTVAGLIDNSYFAQKAGVAQDTPEKGKLKSDDIIALEPYVRRFPDPNMSKLLVATDLHPYGYLGGLPPK
jgi:poly(beta-D-mannuronate) lyase